MLGPGHHLVIDGIATSPVTQEALHWYLYGCPGRVGMTRITTPTIGWTDDTLAGVVIIAESHIAVHVVEVGEVSLVWVDVFSCKPIDDVAELLDFTTQQLHLDPTRTNHQVIVREMPQISVQVPS